MERELGLLEAILLGIVQGLTEWLPVSSSGHLVIAQHFLGVEVPIYFDLVLHLGTLLVVFVFFRKTILEILRAVAAAPAARQSGASWKEVLWDDPARRLALLVIVGTIPTVIIGFTFRDFLVGLYENPRAVAIALLATGTLLWATRYARARPDALGWRRALAIGAIQGAAIIPGISRSGATIGAATLLGLDRETAIRYSFLLSIPAIAGAAVLQTDAAALANVGTNLAAYAAGTLAAMVVGYGALFLLVLLVRRNLFHYFAFYCWGVGGALLYLLARG